MGIEDEEIDARISKCLTEERRKLIQKEEEQDQEVMLEEYPPLPEEQALAEAKAAQVRRIKAIAEEEIMLGEEKVEEVLVEAPKVSQEPAQTRQKELQKHQLF